MKTQNTKFWQQIAAIVGMVVGLMVQVDANASSTTQPPAGFQPKKPNYVTAKQSEAAVIAAVGTRVIRVYQDFVPWFGEGRDQATLLALGKILGVDYFIHPVSDLSARIPADTTVVLITSNSIGSPPDTAAAQNDPTAQANLDAFVQAGGTLIVDMGDNLDAGGFIAPGSVGTPDRIFPDPCEDATLAQAALGPDGILGTADDHPIVKGPDGIPGTGDDLNDSNIDTAVLADHACEPFVAHGNLADGITLPDGATVLMTATFGGVQKPVLAEYSHGNGKIILDTLTKESVAHQPVGKVFSLVEVHHGASFF